MRDFFLIARDGPQAIFAEVCELAATRLPAHYGLDPAADVQVLAPMHKGPLGIDALNAELRARLNPDGTAIAGTGLRVGDKVMQTRNSYEHDLFNGERGVLLHHDDERDRVLFGGEDGRRVSLPVDALDTLRLAYAATVHKAQGSQARAIVVPVFRGHQIMLTRNLVYTAVTRAQEVCVVVGERAALALRGRPHRRAAAPHAAARARRRRLTLVEARVGVGWRPHARPHRHADLEAPEARPRARRRLRRRRGRPGLRRRAPPQGRGLHRPPRRESERAIALLHDELGYDPTPEIVVLVRAATAGGSTPPTPAVRREVDRIAARGSRHAPRRTRGQPAARSPRRRRADRGDGRSLLIAASLSTRDVESDGGEAAEEARRRIGDSPLDVSMGGFAVSFNEVNDETREDLTRAELIAFPILTILLLLVFRGVVAAAIPLLLGVISILGTYLMLRVMSGLVDTSLFALNMATALSLGLAVDYGLLMVSRYREELERAGGATLRGAPAHGADGRASRRCSRA